MLLGGVIVMVATLRQLVNPKPDSGRRRMLVAILYAAILFTLVTLFLRSYAGLKAQTASRRQKLEHMLMDIKTLSPGVSSFDDAMRIGGRNNADRSIQL